MDYSTEKDYLKSIFLKIQLEVIDETELTIRFKKRTFLELFFSEDSLKSLKKYLEIRTEFENSHLETTLISNNYREELVDVINQRTSRMVFWRDEKFIFGNESETEIFATIDNCSDNYVWNKLENEKFLNYILERFRMMRADGDFLKYTKRMFTIKVYNSNQSSVDNNLKFTNPIIDSCIFSFSSLKQATINIVEFFPIRLRAREQNKTKIYLRYILATVLIFQKLKSIPIY